MRALCKDFFDDLRGGFLKPLVERVIADRSLCLEIRKDYFNIYYRGGNLLKLAHAQTGYEASFDAKYFRNGSPPSLPSPSICGPDDVAVWLASFPTLKQAMDLFPKEPAEREVQQIIVRDNNFGAIARSTDYYICDIEYASNYGRFDFVAVRWPSTSPGRKNQSGWRLVLGEVKFGDGALEGDAGLHSHVEDINRHLADPANLAALKTEMLQIFNQKQALGLIDCEKCLVSFSEEKPLLLLVLANHDPDKSRLREVLRSLPDSPHAEVRIASACLLGYGLYDQAILSLEQAFKRFEACI